MSPKIRRAQQDVPPSASGISTLQEATTSAESSNHEDKEHKGEAEPDARNGSKEAEKLVSEEAPQMPDVKPKGAVPEEGSEKPAEDCPKAKEPLPEGEPSVASRLMSEDSREGEADNLSMEGVVLSEDEPELRCDKGDKVNGRFFMVAWCYQTCAILSSRAGSINQEICFTIHLIADQALVILIQRTVI